jgi:dihydrofolate reductase
MIGDKKRDIVLNTFLSLDGVMQAPGGPDEDPSGAFTYGGWSVNYWDDMMGRIMDESMSKPFDLLLGRKTYEIFAAHWPFVPSDQPDAKAAHRLNNAKKYVVSTTLSQAGWNNSTLINGDVVKEIGTLKNHEGHEIQVHGSSNLIQTLLKNDLVDACRLWMFPVVLGSGKRLFGEGAFPSGWKLTGSKVSTTGVLIAAYERAGEIEKGSFALETPTDAEIVRRKKTRDEERP